MKPLLITPALKEFAQKRLKELNINIQMMCIEMGIEQGYYQNIMAGSRTLNPGFIKDFAKQLQTSPKYLEELTTK